MALDLTADPLDLTSDPVALTAALVDVRSVSGNERALADLVEDALRGLGHLEVVRDGDAVVARTSLGRAERVLLAGHLDTVPVADNLPSRVDGDRLYGCGTTDMKAGVAVLLHLAATVREPAYDLTLVCYDNEEVEATRNGLGRLARTRRDLLDADLAILLEPTNGLVEAGCQGTMRAVVRTSGRRAHSARSWLGSNAIHAAGEVLRRLEAYEARSVDIDGCVYREGLNAVRISGGVAGNVVPDACEVTVNFRFAPDRDEAAAEAHVREVFAGYDVEVTDSAPGALPGLTAPATSAFLAAVGGAPVAKYGWTDVARFSELGIPALNFGPGDPNLAHTREEYVEIPKITAGAETLRAYLA
ncbi:MAG TPA: succinyl-diaminopimelate desuccinylase [Mycobacteriales bacterium]|jgi:succinyl-diaminopimelate desuccinylase|nr:succinyl-diaminopimelate desuccinylase [Mycobacteriales bacterium]